MRHIYSFNSAEALEQFIAMADPGFYTLRDASLAVDTNRVRFLRTTAHFRVLALENSTVTFNPDDTSVELMYSEDAGQTWEAYTNGDALDVDMGRAIWFKGVAGNINKSFLKGNGSPFTFTGSVEVLGNLSSLFDGNENETSTTTYGIHHFFKGCRYLHSAAKLVVPTHITTTDGAQHLFKNCEELWYGPSLRHVSLSGTVAAFDSLFSGCTNLREVVALPNSLATTCFQSMYQDCLNLTSIPSTYLPYTTLASGCYTSMFFGCSNLTNACALPATTIPDEAYQSMFSGTDITTPAIWNPTSFGDYAAASMYYGCPLTELPLIPTTATYGDYAFASAFYGTDLEEVTIPAITGDANIFEGAFGSCTDLEKVTINMAAIPATGFKNAFKGCSAITNVVINSTSIGANGLESAFENDTNLSVVEFHVADVTASDCIKDWLKNVAATGYILNLGGATLTPGSTSGVPTGWYAVDMETPEFCMTFNEGGSFYLNSNASNDISLEYSTNAGQTWNTLVKNQSISVSANDKVYFRGDNEGVNSFGTNSYQIFNGPSCKLSGFLTSLVKKTNFIGTTTPMPNMYSTFRDGMTITDAEWLIFPDVIAEPYNNKGNFENMFGNNSLVKAPKIMPATVMKDRCYYGMFISNSSLTHTPQALPAMTLANSCYKEMFKYCTSLTNTMDLLPAETMANNCYQDMFHECTSLVHSVPMNANVAAEYCCTAMYYQCSNLEDTPVLYFSTLLRDSLGQMFRYCSKVNHIEAAMSDISAQSCLYNWLDGVSNSGTFLNGSGINYPRSSSGIPSNWSIVSPDYFYIDLASQGTVTVNNASGFNHSPLEYSTNGVNWTQIANGGSVSAAAGKLYWRNSQVNDPNWSRSTTSGSSVASILTCDVAHTIGGYVGSLYTKTGYTNPAMNCAALFRGDTTLTSAYSLKMPSLTLTNQFNQIFKGCTNLTAIPALKASTLTAGAYQEMCSGCSVLNSISTNASDISATDCLTNWLLDVAATGTFKNLGGATYTSGASGIPSGWTEATAEPLNFTFVEHGLICPNVWMPGNVSLEYSLDNQATWQPLVRDQAVSVPTGGVMYVRGDNQSVTKMNEAIQNGYQPWEITGKVIISGHLMSVVDKTNYATYDQPCPSFAHWFGYTGGQGIAAIVSIDGLVLPSVLSGKVDNHGCLESLFDHCTGLEGANVSFPATTLTDSCYRKLFYDCGVLVTTDIDLPATTATDHCYQQMFMNCSSMNTIPTIGLTDATAYQVMDEAFRGCSSITEIPEIQATVAGEYLYSWAFANCSSLSKVVTHLTDASASLASSYWLNNVAATGDFYDLGGYFQTVERGANGIPEGWTIHTSL